MDPITIIIIVAGLVLFFILALIDNAFFKLTDRLFGMLGWGSGAGPLRVSAVQDGDKLVLSLTN